VCAHLTVDRAARQVGMIDESTLVPESMLPNEGFDKKKEAVVVDPDALPSLEECVNLYDYELVAQKKMAMTGKEKGWVRASTGPARPFRPQRVSTGF
jgi:hypothetical protein